MVGAMAFCANPPAPVCSTSPNASIGEFDLYSRQCSSISKPVVGGLSCLFSSPSIRASACLVNEPSDTSLSSSICSAVGKRVHYSDMWHAELRCEDLAASLKSSSFSPVSVFQAPVSCSSSSSKTPPRRIPRERMGASFHSESLRPSREGCFSTFMNSRLGSLNCEAVSLAEDLRVLEEENIDASTSASTSALDEELAFNIEGNFVQTMPAQREVLESHGTEKQGAKHDSCSAELLKDAQKKNKIHATENQGAKQDFYAAELLKDAQQKNKIFCEQLVVKAFYESEKAHRGQMRTSGVPYFTHCVETAILLASIGSGETIVAAGLLHDTLDDTTMDYDQLCSLFGNCVAKLVEAVSKLSQFSKLARDNNTAFNALEADRLHTMYLAMLDVRVVLIKLADRLHNMMTLEALPFYKQQRFAKETLEIFVPLANRLGISSWKVQLENLCFKHLYPQEYRELSSKLSEGSRETTIMSAIRKLDQALRQAKISYSLLTGREKSLYSIHGKMLKKKLTIDEIHDILGLRLILSNEEDCYAALRIVHQLWPSVPGKLKDYIINPKYNGYQSLHTVVRGEELLRFEVQIRTKKMHEEAEYGLAAHWLYKEGDSAHSSFLLQRVKWARWLITWYSEAMDIKLRLAQEDVICRPPCPFPSHRDDCPHHAKLYQPSPNIDEPIFLVFIEDERMTVQELAPNSTVKDLLRKMSKKNSQLTTYGIPFEELKIKVNDEIVNNIDYKLKMGDVVEFTPSISDQALIEYRERIQRMFDGSENEAPEKVGRSSHVESVATLV
eukprot:TRINITY_DN1126_c0_g1_i1.p1 TRINITY_DN1126_c0_g1~~TRINITY_DN1126_c0_g1_i1.p1  ORF type:complete len:785 (+),score=136.67 TRINITY_DN1126_c0_g1_i1:525-2879(+)